MWSNFKAFSLWKSFARELMAWYPPTIFTITYDHMRIHFITHQTVLWTHTLSFNAISSQYSIINNMGQIVCVLLHVFGLFKNQLANTLSLSIAYFSPQIISSRYIRSFRTIYIHYIPITHNFGCHGHPAIFRRSATFPLASWGAINSSPEPSFALLLYIEMFYDIF